MTENEAKQQRKDLKDYMGKRIMIDKDSPDGEFLGGLCGKVVGYHNENYDKAELMIDLEGPNNGAIERTCIDNWGGAISIAVIAKSATWHGLRSAYVEKNADGHLYVVCKADGRHKSIRISPKHIILLE